jgi:hypothetical protein
MDGYSPPPIWARLTVLRTMMALKDFSRSLSVQHNITVQRTGHRNSIKFIRGHYRGYAPDATAVADMVVAGEP